MLRIDLTQDEARAFADKIDWQNLLNAHERARVRALAVGLHGETGDDGSVWRAWMEAIQDVMTAIDVSLRLRRSIDGGAWQVVAITRSWIDYLAAGKIPDPFEKAATKGGRHRLAGAEQVNARDAVIYRHAVDRGLVNDAHPVKSLQEWFGASRSTIQAWCRDIEPDETELSAPSDLIISRARNAGSFHSEAGRSQRAIKRRDQKRTVK